MKDVNENKKVRKRITLKEYFNGLICVYVYYTNISDTIEAQNKYSLDLLQVLQYFLDDMIYFWYLTILPPVAIILDAIFLKLRKFNYLICAFNIFIIFFNKLILFLFIHE